MKNTPTKHELTCQTFDALVRTIVSSDTTAETFDKTTHLMQHVTVVLCELVGEKQAAIGLDVLAQAIRESAHQTEH